MMHHPPFKTGIAHMDEMGLVNPEALQRIVSRHPQVERILCGHLHRPIQTRFAGTLASTCPSTAHQIALDLSARGAPRFVIEPPGYQLHLWSAEAGLRSHTAAVGEFAGPYPF
jgi:3',5'-cyclic AMP phosphodiesterase CpdA